mmetsp:Transcript_9233/g.11224  ORF Transcript_9233/g.11224 Transcript_9233/m.11224 type:complete len:235 (+) Transcript_9233:205-909(+)
MGRCGHRLELRDGVSNLERLIPLQIIKDLLGLLRSDRLEADRVALALEDLKSGPIDHHLLVQVLSLAPAALVIEQIIETVEFYLCGDATALHLLGLLQGFVTLLGSLLALISLSLRLSHKHLRMGFDQDLFDRRRDSLIQISSLLDHTLFQRAKTALTTLNEVNAVLDLLQGVLAQVNSLQVLPFFHVVQRNVVDNQSVEVEFLELVYCVLDSIDSACDAFLLSIESRDCALGF